MGDHMPQSQNAVGKGPPPNQSSCMDVAPPPSCLPSREAATSRMPEFPAHRPTWGRAWSLVIVFGVVGGIGLIDYRGNAIWNHARGV